MIAQINRYYGTFIAERSLANEQVGSSSLLSRSNLKNAKFRFCVFFMSAIKAYQGLLSSSLISVSKDTVSCWRVTKKKVDTNQG
jgi:hypothetical protein